jgi:hypothetical protein
LQNVNKDQTDFGAATYSRWGGSVFELDQIIFVKRFSLFVTSEVFVVHKNLFVEKKSYNLIFRDLNYVQGGPEVTSLL